METEKIKVLKFNLNNKRSAVVWITNTIENFKKNIGMPGEADEMFLHYLKHLRSVRGERVLVAVACIDGKEKGYVLNRNVWGRIKIYGDFFITAYEQKAHAFKSLSDTEIAEIKKNYKVGGTGCQEYIHSMAKNAKKYFGSLLNLGGK